MAERHWDFAHLKDQLQQSTRHLVNLAEGLEFPWNPNLSDPRQLHNMYARNLITCYVSRFVDLSSGILHAIEAENYLTYALCGRALIETTAILRYYLTEKYRPLLDKPELGAIEMQHLIETDDQHLRGARFDWESFLYGNYSKLKGNAISKLEAGTRKNKHRRRDGALPQQVSIGSCVKSWGRETPEVLVAYDLFCDLVHPNVGSTFLVASTDGDALYFSRFKGEPVGRAILEQSFPILLSVTHRQLPDLLTLLMATIWHDDELRNGPDPRFPGSDSRAP